MTDIKKKQTGKGGAKARKLQLHKETLKDLSIAKGLSPKGGAYCQSPGTAGPRCTQRATTCGLG